MPRRPKLPRLAYRLASGLAFAGAFMPGLAAHAGDPSFHLVNRGTKPIIGLYVTPSGVTHWGHNRLESDGVPAGAAATIHLPRTDQCFYDLRVVFVDHTALEKRHADLCHITDLPVP
jgi:hypothetical protein